MPKIITDKKVIKLRHRTRSVATVLDQAIRASKEKGWNRVIVIGQSRDMHYLNWSAMDSEVVLGMMEIAKLDFLG